MPLARPASLALALALILPAAACGRAPPQGDAAFDARVRDYLLAHPEVVEEALQKLETQKAAEAAKATVQGIRENRTALERDPGDFVANPNGRYTVVEFFDYKCPYCKASAPAVLKLIHDHPDVRFVFKELPILSDVSTHAAEDQLLAKGQGRYLQAFQGLMAAPGLDDAETVDILKTAGVDLKAADTPAARQAAEAHLKATHDLARSIGIEGTPAFIVGDKRIDGWSPDDLDAALKAQRDGASPPAAPSAIPAG